MKLSVINESGYEESALGFSLSYNTSIERAKKLLPKYAFGIPGENKFLESIYIWIDITAPRFWWQEADTYRIGSTKQSESTMHTVCKRLLTQDDFEYPLERDFLDTINNNIQWYHYPPLGEEIEYRKDYFLQIKNYLPEGFLQRRIWCINYKCLQNIYNQRKDHRLPQWKYFCNEILEQIKYPEFIRRENE